MALLKDNAQAALNADFIGFLEAHFPQWLKHVRTLRDEDTNQDFLELTVPNPPGIVHDRPLIISTLDEEITILFGYYHTHFRWSVDHDSRSEVSDFIRSLLNEDIVTVSVWHQGRCRLGSTAYSTGLDRYREIAAGDHELRITSWRGTYNTNLLIDWYGYLETLPNDLQSLLKASYS